MRARRVVTGVRADLLPCSPRKSCTNSCDTLAQMRAMALLVRAVAHDKTAKRLAVL